MINIFRRKYYNLNFIYLQSIPGINAEAELTTTTVDSILHKAASSFNGPPKTSQVPIKTLCYHANIEQIADKRKTIS